MRNWVLSLVLLAVMLVALCAWPLAAIAQPPPGAVSGAAETLQAIAPFLVFFGLCYAFAPAVISVVNRVKQGLRLLDWQTWLLSILLGFAAAESIAYVLRSYGVVVPPSGAVVIVGVLVGLHASGLVDLSKYFGAAPPLRLPAVSKQ